MEEAMTEKEAKAKKQIAKQKWIIKMMLWFVLGAVALVGFSVFFMTWVK